MVHERVVSSEVLPNGKVRISLKFIVDQPTPSTGAAAGTTSAKELPTGGRNMRGGAARLSIDGRVVGEGRFSKFGGFAGSFDAFDVGRDNGSPVSDAYVTPFAFTGTVEQVSIDLTTVK